MNYLSFLIITVAGLLNVQHAQAQIGTATANNFEVVRGTESLSIRSIAQDEKRRIWFGTDKNLYSYDGYAPAVHTDRNGNNDHFQINAIECIGDRLLLGCVDGLVFYDCIKESFSLCDSLQGVEVFAFKRDNDIVWIGSEDGLYRYETETDNLSSIPVYTPSVPSINIRSIELYEDMLLVGTRTSGELGAYDFNHYPVFRTFPKETFPINFSSIDDIVPLEGTHLMLGTSSSLVEFDMATMQASLIAPFSWVKTVCRDGERFLVGTDNGLFSYNPGKGGIEKLANNVVWKIFKDYEQNIWFGSDTGLLVSKRNKLINNTGIAPPDANNLYSSICGDDDGNIFAGGSYGIISFNGSDLDQPCKWYKMADPDFPLNHNKVRQIKLHPYSGDIWAETAGGLIRYDNKTRQFSSTRADITLSNAYDFLLEKDRFWIAGLNGLYCVRNGYAIESYTVNDGLSSNRIAQVVKDCTDKLWIRTIDRNVYIINPSNETVSHFYLKEAASGSTWDYIYADSSSNIWLSSGNNIYKVEPRISSSIVADYHLEAQMSAETNCMIDIGNNIWTCSSAGIFIINKTTGLINHIYSDENYVSLYYDKKAGRIYLGALDRIDMIDYADFLEIASKSNPQVYITKIVVNDNITIPAEEYADGTLVLPHDLNNITISFSGFRYSRENAQRFRFNLNGSPSGWFETTRSSNSILLTDLAPKAYKLYVSTINYPNTERPLLSIRIKRPWYASVGAFLIYLLLATFAVVFIVKQYLYRKRINIERLQKTKEIAQAKSKISFFADVAHEFKTPLSLIIAPVSKLIQDSSDIKDKQSLQLVYDNAMKLNSLIHMSLDYYNDKKDLAKTVISSNVEFVSFARQIFQSFKDNFPKLDFSFVSNSDEIFITLDVIKMETILTNIISNACKYTPSEGSVILSIAYNKDGGILVIKVSDTGIGIPKEELPYIFQRYYQSSRTKSNVASTGLGLSIVKNYVEIMKGDITAESDGHGTSFLIKIPASSNIPENAESDAASLENKGHKPLIVIVDDNKSICDFLVNILHDKYNCLCAHNGAKGLKLCQDVVPDLIISDVVMPDMNGLQMCREIRKIHILSIVPIILLTAKDDKDTERESIDLNIDALIGKPFDMEALLARVSRLIAKNQQVEKKVRIDMISKPTDEKTISQDEKFLIHVTKIIENHIDEPDLSVTKLCELGNYTEKNLYRKIKKLTGLTTVEYVRSIRMKKAALLLQNGNFTVSETMYMVGFSNTSYFSKAFNAQFGKTPKEYQQSFKTLSAV